MDTPRRTSRLLTFSPMSGADFIYGNELNDVVPDTEDRTGRVQDRTGRDQDRTGRNQDRTEREQHRTKRKQVRRDQDRTGRIRKSMRSPDDGIKDINYDAEKYSKILKGSTQFHCCGRCGRAESKLNMMLLSKVKDRIDRSTLKADFHNLLSGLNDPLDIEYKCELQKAFTDGIINGTHWICIKPCVSTLPKVLTKRNHHLLDHIEEDDDDDNDDTNAAIDNDDGNSAKDDDDAESELDVNCRADPNDKLLKKRPIDAFRFFAGPIPEQLKILSNIETSMISGVYCCILCFLHVVLAAVNIHMVQYRDKRYTQAECAHQVHCEAQ